jgi:hypothetical protein
MNPAISTEKTKSFTITVRSKKVLWSSDQGTRSVSRFTQENSTLQPVFGPQRISAGPRQVAFIQQTIS